MKTTNTTKTLNVDVVVHHLVKVAAAEAGMPIGEFAEVLLRVGLGRPKEVKQLLGSRTTPEARPPKA